MFLSQKRNLFDIYGTNGFFNYNKNLRTIRFTNCKKSKCMFAANAYVRNVYYQRYQLDEIVPTMQIKQFSSRWKMYDDPITLIYFTAQARLLYRTIDQIRCDSICFFSFRFQPLKFRLQGQFVCSRETYSTELDQIQMHNLSYIFSIVLLKDHSLYVPKHHNLRLSIVEFFVMIHL